MEFKNERRQKFLGEKNYVDYDAYLRDSATRAKNILATRNLVADAKSSFRWRIASEGLEHLILQYTAGRPIDELRDALPQVIHDFDVYIENEISPRSEKPPRAVADTLEITQLEAYVYVFWLLALCKLLQHDEFIPKVLDWVNRTGEFNRGRDILFENVVQALTGSHVASERVVLHVGAYRLLARATLYAPEERPALVREFVENWYKSMKSCYWHGTHTGNGFGYFGYWCLEAALVTVLWEIDDSSYRDNLVYPKDLVDYARQQQAAARAADTPKPHISRRTGERCPYAGRWGVLESPGAFVQERMFKVGDEFPEGIGRDRQEGPVTWIVMGREDGGPTREE